MDDSTSHLLIREPITNNRSASDVYFKYLEKGRPMPRENAIPWLGKRASRFAKEFIGWSFSSKIDDSRD
jgi:hypothetical protein